MAVIGAGRRTTVTLAGLCAAIVVVGAITLAVGHGDHRVYEPVGTVIVRSDDRTLVVETDDGGPDCNLLSSPSLSETATTVALTLSWPPPKDSDLICAGVGLAGPKPVGLRAPLGHRRVIDVGTQRPVALIYERALPRIAPVPPGFAPGPIETLDAGLGPNAVTRTYSSAARGVAIRIDCWQGQPRPLYHQVVARHLLVDGQRAQLVIYHRSGIEVLWSDHGFQMAVSSDSHGAAAPNLATDADVIRFAQAVTAPAS